MIIDHQEVGDGGTEDGLWVNFRNGYEDWMDKQEVTGISGWREALDKKDDLKRISRSSLSGSNI